jgi:two-component system, NtrC family, sensor kinase
MMRRLFSILITITFFLDGFGQYSQKVDSLNKVLSTGSDDTLRGKAIWALCREFVYTKPDSCLYYGALGFDLINDPAVKNFESSNNFDLRYFEAFLYVNGAIALSEQRSDSLAVIMGLKGLHLIEKANDKTWLRRVFSSLGEIYQNIGEPAISLDYNKRALAIGDSEISPIFIASIGACFYDLKQYDSALYYLHKVDPTFETSPGNPWPYPDTYLGNTYSKKGDYLKAISFFQSAIRKSKQSKLTQDLSLAYTGLSNAFKALGKLDSGIAYAGMALHIADEYSFPSLSLDASNLLSSLYESKGLVDSAFRYQKISLTLRDTLFNKERIQQVQNFTFSERFRQQDLAREKTEYRNKIKLYVLLSGLALMILFSVYLVRNSRQKQKANLVLGKTLSTLKATQSQLIHAEKMASLGELSAGIAHEIQNPLNFVNNFSEVSNELISEMVGQADKGNLQEVKSMAQDVQQNLDKILHHGKRADAIVKGMLQHSRSSSGKKEPTDINALADEYLRLAYQGFRAKDKSFNAVPIAIGIKTNFDPTVGKINVVPQEMGRVMLNLINNAFYAVHEKKKKLGDSYQPIVTVSSFRNGSNVEIRVSDNGDGIPEKIRDKIFQPFFTTKPTGEGTGLGLSLAYDIVTKGHGGDLTVETKEGIGSEFLVAFSNT